MRLFVRAGEIMRKEMAPRAGTAFARFGRAGAEVRIQTIREARGPCLARCRRAARLRFSRRCGALEAFEGGACMIPVHDAGAATRPPPTKKAAGERRRWAGGGPPAWGGRCRRRAGFALAMAACLFGNGGAPAGENLLARAERVRASALPRG
ncbi:hypothetical protein [Burkholderia pseudomallei]|uniref:hypothetical protein n=1 Tax=Burkholderia pseudomallei TaxID=28450 RepID=UPI00097786F3|nr:hypothetical protein [Burkholderia pseudomallei]